MSDNRQAVGFPAMQLGSRCAFPTAVNYPCFVGMDHSLRRGASALQNAARNKRQDVSLSHSTQFYPLMSAISWLRPKGARGAVKSNVSESGFSAN